MASDNFAAMEKNSDATTASQTQENKSELVDVVQEQLDVQCHPSERDENGIYLSGPRLWLVSIGLMSGVFIMALDTNIIATAIPKITSDFHSLDQVGWYGSAYLLTQMSLQPTFGKIYTYFPVKWTFLAAIFVFELGSIVIATAPNSTVFIIGRAIAGSGAAGIFNGSMIIIGHIVPLKERPQYMAVLSSTYGIAAVAGPLLGGVFTDSSVLTWRFCFWISLPFGGFAALMMLLFLQIPKQAGWTLPFKQKISKMDLSGAVFLIAAMVCLLLALQWGGNKFPWSSPRVYGCLIGFGLFLAVFIAMQARDANNVTIPFRIITQRTIAFSCAFTMTLAMVSSEFSYFLPIFFQAVEGDTAAGSGIKILPFLLSLTIITLFVGAAITAVGYYVPFMWVGASLALMGSALLFTLKVNSSTGKLIGYQIVAGLGIGSCVQTPFIAAQVVLPDRDMPSGMSIIGFFNALGGTLAISMAQNIFSNALLPQLRKIQGIDAKALADTGATNLANRVPPVLLNPVLAAFSYAITRAFILAISCAAMALVCSFFMEFKSVKEKNAGALADEEQSTNRTI